jgi:large subunit ribosomal protein L37Ae
MRRIRIIKKKQICPYCERVALKRVASGIWYCKKCKVKFAGGAYTPKT